MRAPVDRAKRVRLRLDRSSGFNKLEIHHGEVESQCGKSEIKMTKKVKVTINYKHPRKIKPSCLPWHSGRRNSERERAERRGGKEEGRGQRKREQKGERREGKGGTCESQLDLSRGGTHTATGQKLHGGLHIPTTAHWTVLLDQLQCAFGKRAIFSGIVLDIIKAFTVSDSEAVIHLAHVQHLWQSKLFVIFLVLARWRIRLCSELQLAGNDYTCIL